MRMLSSPHDLTQQFRPMLLRSWEAGCFGSAPEDGTGADTETPRLPREAFPSLTELLEESPYSVGRLFGAIQNCANTATVFLLQCPPIEDVDGFYAYFHAQLVEWYSDDTTKPDVLCVIHTFVVAHLMALSNMENFAQFRLMLLPYSPQRMEIAYDMTWRVPSLFLGGLIDTFLPIFKERWSLAQFDEFAQSFVATVRMDLHPDLLTEEMNYPTVQSPINFDSYLSVLGVPYVDYTDFEYIVPATRYDSNKVPVGPRIPMYEFCRLVLPVEPDITCAICKELIDNAFTEEENEPVMTHVCGHHFHALCLDIWVNGSAVPSSGTCPLCRTALCETRSCAPKECELGVYVDEQTMVWD